MKVYPSLYNLARNKKVSVVKVLNASPLNISFRRALVGAHWDKWMELVGSVLHVQLDDQDDEFRWGLGNKVFSTQLMYKDIMRREGIPRSCFNWKVKLPLKIKIFLWYLHRGVVLTTDNLLKKIGRGVRDVFFVTQKRVFNIYFLTVKWLDWFGVRSPLPLGLDRCPR
jgi:hypothetical protein